MALLLNEFCHNLATPSTSNIRREYRLPYSFLYLFLAFFFSPLAGSYLSRYDTPMIQTLIPPVKLRAKLLRWYSQHKRDLPWRHTRDPYKIWVSEIMLQQTQVSTVIPYYKRWLEVFPTLASLAQAPLSRALELWAGLGYYRRARMFHLAAQQVQKDRGGHIPKTARELRELPGIGRYTAGAIASIALGEKTPVLDGNVIRILSRIFALSQSVDLPETLERLWGLAASLLPESNPGDLNQAMMELGATVCFPLIPKCTHCPINKVCAARKKGRELSYPVRTRKDRYEKLRMAALVLKNSKNEVWLEKQPDQGRWGGLWMWVQERNCKVMTRGSGNFAIDSGQRLSPQTFAPPRISCPVRPRSSMPPCSGALLPAGSFARTFPFLSPAD